MPEAPDRTQRAQCWKARDAFFVCLDTHGIVDSIEHGKEAARDCGSDLKAFESNCASSWVSPALGFLHRAFMHGMRDSSRGERGVG